MDVQSVLHTIDGISTWVGKAAAWLIMILMAVVCIEVIKRYLLNAPTAAETPTPVPISMLPDTTA